MAYQVSVFMQNKPGQLEKTTSVLEEAAVNIRAVTISTGSSGWGILNLLVSEPERACQILCSHGHTATLRRIVVVRVEDRPGGLRHALQVLGQAGLNVQNAYGSAITGEHQAILVIDVDSVEQAEGILDQSGVPCLTDEQIYAI